MKAKHRRLILVLLALCSLGLSFFIISKIFKDNLVFFFSPSELIEKNIGAEKLVRIGGLVQTGSVKKTDGKITFIVTDLKKSIIVEYSGLLPDLFREGQGVVAQGYYDGKIFSAKEVLAKHDEKYMPPEVAQALKKSGHWKEGEAK